MIDNNLFPTKEKSKEVNYKKDFCLRYFDVGTWELDVLHEVDILLHDKKNRPLLYIEAKDHINSDAEHKKALAQTVITHKKQDLPLSYIALIYPNKKKQDTLELIDCLDNSIMYNNDINWKAEKASNPSSLAIKSINDRLVGHITVYQGEELIKEFYKIFKRSGKTQIGITVKNVNFVYNQWKQEVKFRQTIENEQELINLFLVDLLNGTKYEKDIKEDIVRYDLFDGRVKIGEKLLPTDQPLIREGTNLGNFEIIKNEGKAVGIAYTGTVLQVPFRAFASTTLYYDFWRRYHRPPEKYEFLEILEHSASLYSEKYRSDTGGEYTPSCFVEKQNELLAANGYRLDDYIVFDPCAGVGNLENDFGIEYKQYCYLSTLEQHDVDTCKIKGFENAVQFDYLSTPQAQPLWKYKGEKLNIQEIARREGRKLMVVMNPPYKKLKRFSNNLAIEFFNKVLSLNPETIVFYYTTGSFHRNEIEFYKKSGYKIVSHIFSNAKTTFKLHEWSISQVIFDKEKGNEINDEAITADRYELEKDKLIYKGTYTYNNARPNLFFELQQIIRDNAKGIVLGNVSYMNDVIKIGNGGINRGNSITSENLKYCLLSKGLIFNTHHHYFELNSVVHKGTIEDIDEELFNDAIMFSLFYKGILFTNKGHRNYIMPFTAEELGCEKNDLNVKYESDIFTDGNCFDFREFLKQFTFSSEAKELYNAALKIFLFYHRKDEYSYMRDWNDSYYDITNAIMGKDITKYKTIESTNDRRINRVKTTKGTRGFSRQSIKDVIEVNDLTIFNDFFDARDALARKINSQLIDKGLLLWKRENLF